MQVHSLDFNDFLEEEYSLIGIHTSLEDYKLAYLLNKELKVNFVKSAFNLDFSNKKNNASFAVFNYKNCTLDFEYFLIANSYKENKIIPSNRLLLSSEIKTYLIPEKKRVDFFLKIIGNTSPVFISKTIEKVKKIPQIITSYSVDVATLKSKEFLIF